MRTLFSCPELAVQFEGFDAHDYEVDEQVRLRLGPKLVRFVVHDVTMDEGLRKVSLRPLGRHENLSRRASHVAGRPDGKGPGPDWIDEFCSRIEGGKGPVRWHL